MLPFTWWEWKTFLASISLLVLTLRPRTAGAWQINVKVRLLQPFKLAIKRKFKSKSKLKPVWRPGRKLWIDCWINCQEDLHRCSWFPEDESSDFWSIEPMIVYCWVNWHDCHWIDFTIYMMRATWATGIAVLTLSTGYMSCHCVVQTACWFVQGRVFILIFKLYYWMQAHGLFSLLWHWSLLSSFFWYIFNQSEEKKPDGHKTNSVTLQNRNLDL